MIIAVDYDGTLERDGEMNRALIERLKANQRRGAVIILWTCRNGDRLFDAVQKLRKNGLTVNYVNCNAPETIKKLGYDPRKVFADIYIDDKAVS